MPPEKLENGHETALELVSGADFLCVLHNFSGPGSFKRTPGSFKRTPGSFKRTPGSFQRTPRSFQRTRGPFKGPRDFYHLFTPFLGRGHVSPPRGAPCAVGYSVPPPIWRRFSSTDCHPAGPKQKDRPGLKKGRPGLKQRPAGPKQKAGRA